MSGPKYRRMLLKISGEAFCKPNVCGIDGQELNRIAAEIHQCAEVRVQLAVVTGGGNLMRGDEVAAQSGIQPATGHYMGMLSTVINALALQDTLEARGLQTRVQSAIAVDRVCEKFIRRRCIRHLEKGRIVILAAGTGNPFVTTDTCAALRAVEIGADVVLKATKVDGVYSDDPLTNPSAKRFETLTFDEAIRLRLGIMDVSAFDLCQQNHVPVVVFSLDRPGNMKRVVTGDRSVGTLISND